MSDGPHEEPLALNETDGLCLPDEFIGHDGGLVVRMPSGATIDFKPREWGGHVGNVRADHFGEVNEEGTNAHLEADQVELRKYGEEPNVYRVDLPDEEVLA